MDRLVCPDCDGVMLKAWVNCEGLGERSVWLCLCSGIRLTQVWEDTDEDIVLVDRHEGATQDKA